MVRLRRLSAPTRRACASMGRCAQQRRTCRRRLTLGFCVVATGVRSPGSGAYSGFLCLDFVFVCGEFRYSQTPGRDVRRPRVALRRRVSSSSESELIVLLWCCSVGFMFSWTSSNSDMTSETRVLWLPQSAKCM